jgi:hypothetical protein
MKKELLEYLIRECVQEVLEAFPTATDPTTLQEPLAATSAPPEVGQAVPPVPQGTTPLFTADTRGVWYVDPKTPQKPVQMKVTAQDPAKLERELYRIAAKSGGPRLKVAGETLREVPKVLANPNTAIFLYVGKRNPDDADTDLYLLPAKTYQQAKDGTVAPGVSADYSNSQATDLQDPVANMQAQQAGGKTMAPDIDESAKFKNMISTMIRESLSEIKRKR